MLTNAFIADSSEAIIGFVRDVNISKDEVSFYWEDGPLFFPYEISYLEGFNNHSKLRRYYFTNFKVVEKDDHVKLVNVTIKKENLD